MLVLGLAACSNPGYFVCTLDSECTEAPGGRCEPSGACSIPDASCPTGRRYGELGNPDVAGQCVPADDIGSTSSDPTAASGSAASETTGDSSPDASTADSQGPGDSSSTASASEVGTSDASGSSSAGSSSTTGAGVPPDLWANCETEADCAELCAPVVDVASLEPIGRWCTGFVCEDPVVDCTDPGTGAIPDCLTLAFDGRLAPRCILDCTDTGSAGCPEGMECFDVFMSTSRCAHPVSG